MKLLPFRVVPLVSELPPDTLAGQLRGLVGLGPAVRFAGAVAADGFIITRMNDYRSTIMPLLRGGFLARPGGGTEVRVRVRPAGSVIAFMGIWLTFLAVFAAIVVFAHARDASRSLLVLLAPAGLGAFSWYLMLAVFTADARWAVEHLLESVPALHKD